MQWNEAVAGRSQAYMSDTERVLQRRIIKLLHEDKYGQHHDLYAKRFKTFALKIVPYGSWPDTAAVSFEKNIIYVNRGVLSEDDFDQVGVVIRHEMLHNLLMHEIRMAAEVRKDHPELADRMDTSNTFQEFFNTIMDFEVSQHYSAKDKDMMHKLKIGARTISGLIVEDFRINWMTSSLEDMYQAVWKEVEKYDGSGRIDPNTSIDPKYQYGANLSHAVQAMHEYKSHTQAKVTAFATIDDFRQSLLAPARRYNKNAVLDKHMEDILSAYEAVPIGTGELTIDRINSELENIAATGARDSYDVINPVTGELIAKAVTPEEKMTAQQCLDILAQRDTWFVEIQNQIRLQNLTPEQIKELYDIVK